MKNPEFEIVTTSERDTYELGKRASEYVYAGLIVLLSGDLGTGKTVFVRGLAEGLGAHGVRSPSFTIVNEYSGKISIAHVDLYRLSTNHSMEVDMEFYMANQYLILVEWPEAILEDLREDYWHIRFGMATDHDPEREPGSMDLRKIRFTGRGLQARERLNALFRKITEDG